MKWQFSGASSARKTNHKRTADQKDEKHEAIKSDDRRRSYWRSVERIRHTATLYE
jgi:hypothetical protein